MHLNTFLMKLGCEKSDTDLTVYLLRKDEKFVFLMSYAEDIVMIGNLQSAINGAIKRFPKSFETCAS